MSEQREKDSVKWTGVIKAMKRQNEDDKKFIKELEEKLKPERDLPTDRVVTMEYLEKLIEDGLDDLTLLETTNNAS